MQKYEIEYNIIVKKKKQQMYNGPERQANSIKKCSVLKRIKEIEYSSAVQRNTK